MEVKVWSGYELEKSVCNHGFFMMAPNHWIPSTKTLTRPIRLTRRSDDNYQYGDVVTISISQPSSTSLSITIQDVDHLIISPPHQQEIMDQVKRMLRLSDEDENKVKEFHRLHEEAAKRGFGHLFRNPTLFEDIVKSLLLCCCKFETSLEMAESLCKLKKGSRKRCRNGSRKTECLGNFPSAQELANLQSEKLLRKKCKLGLRADPIFSLAKAVTNGDINLMDYEFMQPGDEKLMIQKLKRIKGIGEFVACNVLMCMGFYQHVPIDTETIRLIKEVHERKECDKKNVKAIVKEIYDKYAPFQTLVYWLEMVEYYEKSLGKLSLLERCDYKKVAGSMINATCNST